MIVFDDIARQILVQAKLRCPKNNLLTFMMASVPKSMPLHNLLAVAVAKVLYHQSGGLDGHPYGFGVRVQRNIDKPYGLCEECYAHHDNNNSAEHYEQATMISAGTRRPPTPLYGEQVLSS
jgi:hypothetical protein